MGSYIYLYCYWEELIVIGSIWLFLGVFNCYWVFILLLLLLLEIQLYCVTHVTHESPITTHGIMAALGSRRLAFSVKDYLLFSFRGRSQLMSKSLMSHLDEYDENWILWWEKRCFVCVIMDVAGWCAHNVI